MAPSKTGKAAPTAKPKKEKVHHPSSRKASQLARSASRKGKLGNLAAKRGQKHNSLVDVYGFFYHAMPELGVLTLEELHHMVRDIWLTRFDEELEQERATRRKGRPKSVKEMKLEELKVREAEEYRTGLEVPDLTHAPTVELFRRWDQKEAAFIQLLRFIRIFRDETEVAVVSRPGRHISILGTSLPTEQNYELSIVDQSTFPDQIMAMPPTSLVPLLLPLAEPPSRFSSTMMTMDEPIL